MEIKMQIKNLVVPDTFSSKRDHGPKCKHFAKDTNQLINKTQIAGSKQLSQGKNPSNRTPNKGNTSKGKWTDGEADVEVKDQISCRAYFCLKSSFFQSILILLLNI